MRITLFIITVLLSLSLAEKSKKKKGQRGAVQRIIPQDGASFVAGIGQHASINATVRLQKPFKGAPVAGTNLWEMSVWFNKLRSGKDERIGTREGQVLSPEQSGQILQAGQPALHFQDIGITADLRGYDCSKIKYLCASFTSRSPALRVKANNVGCTPVTCIECGSQVCTADYRPVCGTDRITYSNLCQLQNSACDDVSLIVANEGECERACGSDFCTLDYTPVCGSDEQTYSNECSFNNAVCDTPDLVKVSEGVCEPACGSDFCALDYTPVCGSDGQTYSNECFFNNAVCDNPELVIVNQGECEPACGSDFCTLDYTPVCGSDGQTYSNECSFNNAVCYNPELVIVNQGECEPACGSDFCTLDYTPVCGSDGQTYSNECSFNNAVCYNPELVIVNQGECEPECGSDFCTADYTPVCGTDGQTYSNLCNFENAACGITGLVVDHEGECVIACGSDFCTLDYTPVCGSDGRTYSNECSFNNAVCDIPDLVKVSEGECEPECGSDFCALDYTPVCGSDGQTYSNECFFNNAVCDNPELVIANQEECEPECVSNFCTADYAPVCGSDSQTYSNLCNFENAACGIPGLVVDHEGECVMDPCAGVTCAELPCPEDLQHTYEGSCCPECPQDWGLDPCVLSGTCEEPKLDCSRRKCSRENAPVCGSDGNNYNNPCLFRYAVYCDDRTLTLVSEGPCDRLVDPCAGVACEELPCPGDLQHTYEGSCCQECPQDWGVPPCVISGSCGPVDPCAGVACEELPCPVDLQNTYEGSCCPECPQDWGLDPCDLGGCEKNPCDPRPACIEIYDPVCGSDGRTYSNGCLLGVTAMCDDTSLIQTREGRCSVLLDGGRLSIALPKGRKPVIRLDVEGVVSADSPTVEGENLWRMELYSARTDGGNSTDSYEYRYQVLDARGVGSTARTGKKFGIRNVRVQYPLWDAACNGFGYLCARFSAIESADPALGDDVNLSNCVPVDCP